MQQSETLWHTADRLRDLADRSPTEARRAELLDMAAEYDRLAGLVGAMAEARTTPAGRA